MVIREFASYGTKFSIEAGRHRNNNVDVVVMLWRILLVLLKSGLTVALFEVVRPIAEAVGVQLSLVATIAKAISSATAIPYREAEVLFLLVFAATMLEIARIVRDLLTS
jgi:hypothetical protein